MPTDQQHAFSWRDGVYTDLNDVIAPNGFSTRVEAINDRSTIFGSLRYCARCPVLESTAFTRISPRSLMLMPPVTLRKAFSGSPSPMRLSMLTARSLSQRLLLRLSMPYGNRSSAGAHALAVVRGDHRIELVVVHWLDQVPIEACLQRAAVVFRLSVPAQRHQHHSRTFGRLPQSPCDFKAAQPGQSNIEEYNLGLEAPRGLKSGRTVEGNVDLMVIKPEQHRATLGGIRTVIHNQNATRIAAAVAA
jgi:hypothetical protein